MALLSVRGLKKRYGSVDALSDLTFDIGQHEIVGLIGPNGAGKSTAINLISGAIPATAGSVHFDGEQVLKYSCHELVRRGLLRTFQNVNLFGTRTVRENVLRGAFSVVYRDLWSSLWDGAALRRRRAVAEERVNKILLQLNLQELADVKAATLPYGHQKLVGLAIALAADPKLIMLDEPAAGLNGQEARHLVGVIRNINQRGVSILIVDHNMRFVLALCSRVVVLHHGQELAMGAPRDVFKDPRVMDAYLGHVDEPA
ncbi:ABC transporter ATP-binding protein [Bradyrhizobium sp. NP1]|uniref:ABC transporter ATP-binding protein n=1 Tax=Bradyrhizobium sp. NP1 TaxID=3049772 RepID=UPI0025A5269C|nr:ABC transporter ATP-binding protein [Bradyrhizobium sp. NP1]WJR81941.1 ABC transporter ATP-binding protein [Bradyrhizobium sp. NP1]